MNSDGWGMMCLQSRKLAKQGSAVLTLNRKHFIQIHNSHSQHAGILVCTFDPDFVSQARRIQNAIESQVKLSGQLIRINRPAVG